MQELCRSHYLLPKLSVPKGCCSVPAVNSFQLQHAVGMQAAGDPASPCHCFTSHLEESPTLILHTQSIQGPSADERTRQKKTLNKHKNKQTNQQQQKNNHGRNKTLMTKLTHLLPKPSSSLRVKLKTELRSPISVVQF